MDFLQIALIFLIILLSIFLSITGVQVFFILRDLKKALDKLNKVLEAGEGIASDIEKPISAAVSLIDTISAGAKAIGGVVKKSSKPSSNKSSRRFYKKVL